MKTTTKLKVNITTMPNGTEVGGRIYMVQIQYTPNGLIFTNNNNGKGFTLEEAQDIAFGIKDELRQ